ncbi:hypothetical protein E3N88_14399 [Mikania micrantha]|uniref:Retrovirus-related Pol polyprotein from transposon TNT 1-94-like beta-barrel domain-containing protein n=1 Tax=Mikania micrantha TaxID=192012 RepID=A0A5N6P1E3_9ASTR|nr:hypothetical protein E3N88_14399 [Mikania micrantha]
MDSGASVHATRSTEGLKNLKFGDFGKVRLANNEVLNVTSMGDIDLKTPAGSLNLKNVRIIPSLKRRLISVGQLDNQGHEVKFKKGQWKVVKGNLVMARGKKKGSLYLINISSEGVTVPNECAWKDSSKTVRGLCGSGSTGCVSTRVHKRQWVKRTSVPVDKISLVNHLLKKESVVCSWDISGSGSSFQWEKIEIQFGSVAVRAMSDKLKLDGSFNVPSAVQGVAEPSFPTDLEYCDKDILIPFAILDSRVLTVGSSKKEQCLIQWENQSTEEATWEDKDWLFQQFPNQSYEDKTPKEGAGIDRNDATQGMIQKPPILHVYSRRGKTGNKHKHKNLDRVVSLLQDMREVGTNYFMQELKSNLINGILEKKKRGEGIRVPAYHHSSEIRSSRITTRFHQVTNRLVSSISLLLESKHHEAVNPLPCLLPPLNFSPSVIAIRYCYNLHEPSEIPRPIVHSCPIGGRPIRDPAAVIPSSEFCWLLPLIQPAISVLKCPDSRSRVMI